LKARQIASFLATDRTEINQILYSNLNDFVVDGAYVWKLKTKKQSQTITKKEPKNEYKIGDSVVGLKVKHNRFGTGVITEQDDKYISVEFATKTSRFEYPVAFKLYIEAEDTSVQGAIMDAIKAKDEADWQRINKALEEWRKAEAEREEREKQRRAELAANAVKTKKTTTICGDYESEYRPDKLSRDRVLTYQEVEKEFGIRISGFGRGINPTNKTVVLISSINKSGGKFVYHDRWTADGEYIYSGEGKNGHQTMTRGNMELRDAALNGKKIHLFVKFSPREYYYQGIFELVDYTCEHERDEGGYSRREYKFRLRRR
jgi:hypothetical protein